MKNKATSRRTTFGWAVAGIAFGAAVMWLIQSGPTNQSAAVPTATLVAPKDISSEEADSLRKSAYASLATIDDILSLPGEFAEVEALYALASRADAAGLQGLIGQASAVTQPLKRERMLSILLTRLAELDPMTALAVVKGPLSGFREDYASVVWRAWASRDFDSALAAAQQTTEGRDLIAQALYGALPTLDDPRAGEIAAVLGVPPDSTMRARELSRLYATSADLAISQFNLTAGKDDAALATELAGLLLAEHDTAAIEYLDDITDPALRRRLRDAILQLLVDASPEKAIEVITAKDWETSSRRLLGEAMGSLAKRDPADAMQRLSGFPMGLRAGLELDMINAIAETDFVRAFAMADEAKYADQSSIVGRLVGIAVKSDIALAIELVAGIDDPQKQRMSVMQLISRAEIEDLASVADFAISLREGGRLGGLRLTFIASRWAREDPDAALDWAQTLPTALRATTFASVVSTIAEASPEKAMALASARTGPGTDEIRRSLADSLARMNMIDEALSLAANATTEDARRSIRLAALSRVIENDVDRALALASQLGDKSIQEVILARALSANGRVDPTAALERLEEIDNPALRQRLEVRMIRQLANRDPDAARARVNAMPRGERYDNAAKSLALSSAVGPSEAFRIADTIDDDQIRSFTRVQTLMRIARDDVGKARRLAKDLEISDEDRDKFELFLLQRGVHYW